ncbi:hypothetical protein F5Y10DRAFT_272143 [Nemania abortiva]|nr:hypothetical protein F5Y10DRAFT_272143 [Nemania abortiva]
MSPDFSTGDDQGQGPSQGPVQGQGQPGFMPSTQYYNYPVYNHQWPNAQTSSYSNGYARDPDPGPDDIISYPAATQDLALGYSPPPALASSASPTTAMTDLSRQFPCTMCPNSFKYRKDLNRHLDTVHKTLDDPVYRCRCGKTDTRKDNCRRHVRNCKGKHPDRYFICKCGSTFTVKEEYIAHFADCHFTRPGP